MLLSISVDDLPISLGWRRCILPHSLPSQIAIETSNAFQDGFCDERVCVGTDHDIRFYDVFPHWQPTALLIVRQHTLYHPWDAVRDEEYCPGPLGAECIPD